MPRLPDGARKKLSDTTGGGTFLRSLHLAQRPPRSLQGGSGLSGAARLDAEYFGKVAGRSFEDDEEAQIKACLLEDYRWQSIFSGVEHPRFQALLGSLITKGQIERSEKALTRLRSSTIS
jgi:hypothetical protein